MVVVKIVKAIKSESDIYDIFKIKQIGTNDIKTVTYSQLKDAVDRGLVKVNNLDFNKISEMEPIVKELNIARKEYEQNDNEIMTNYEYDNKYNKLEELEKSSGITLSDSPTQNVGYEVVSNLVKEKHNTPILSLDKTKDRDLLSDWLGDKAGILSWKLDGLTVVLTYNNGKLEKAVTRGNGEVGELVTNNAKHFINLPKEINYKEKLVIRGEAVIRYSIFNKINETVSEKYKNPRNLASGSVRQLDSRVTASRNVEFYAFNIEGSEENIYEQYKYLKELGFSVVEHLVVNKENIMLAIESFEKKVKSFDIPTDGLVLTYDNRKYGLTLGRTSKFYRHSIAFKWGDEEAETELIDIEWQVGRTGIITPVAIFKPVELEGSTVERASLHNLSIMEEVLGQPFVGQRIRVYKANMIIPQIIWGEKVEME